MNKLFKISGKNNILRVLNDFQSIFPHLIEKIDNLDSYADKLSRFAEVYCAYKDDRMFGLLVLYANDIENKKAYITLIGVKKDFEHMGLGTYLLNEAMNIARTRGMKHIKLEVDNDNLHAVEFYERNGFCVCGETQNNSKYMINKL